MLPAEVISMSRTFHEAAALGPPEMTAVLTRELPEAFNRNEGLSGTGVFLAGLIAAQARNFTWQQALADWRASLGPFTFPLI